MEDMALKLSEIVGNNIRQLRVERGMTLGQLAKEAKVSKSILAEIEKGNSNPTVNTIMKLSKGLNVSYTRLMVGLEPDTAMVRREELVMQASENQHYRIFCYFTTSAKRNFELFRVELDPGCSHVAIAHPPKSQEYVYILEGELELELESDRCVMKVGDAFGFASSVPHTYHNEGDTMVVFLCVNYHPDF